MATRFDTGYGIYITTIENSNYRIQLWVERVSCCFDIIYEKTRIRINAFAKRFGTIGAVLDECNSISSLVNT
jgi:hypothetical protein